MPAHLLAFCELHLLLAGLAFLAFGFNLVDCGALLGHRLGSNAVVANPKSAKRVSAFHAHPPLQQFHAHAPLQPQPKIPKAPLAARTFTL